MTWSNTRDRTCTLCSASFRIHGPDMLHPADILCDPCIIMLWGSTQDGPTMEKACTGRISADQGLDPAMVASAIVRRVHELRHVARSSDELEQVLASRRPRR